MKGKLLAGYNIRKALPADVDAIAIVHLEVWRETYQNFIEKSDIAKISLSDRINLRKKILTENVGVHLVVTYHDRIIGFYDAGPLRFHKNQQLSEEQVKNRNELGEVYAIYLLKEYQNIHLGSDLFQAGKLALNKLGLIPFIAWVLKDNYRAIKFYERQNGKLVDETKVKIGNNFYSELAYQFF